MCLESQPDDDVCVVPVILSSDKTNVTFSGSKEAHNVYETTGALDEDIRQGNDCIFLDGQIPHVDAPESVRRTGKYKVQKLSIFHEAYRIILKSFERATTKPITVKCGDGVVRKLIFPVALHVGDWPEQCDICGLMSSTGAKLPCNYCEVPQVRALYHNTIMGHAF